MKTLDELMAEDPAAFMNPPISDEAFAAQIERNRIKAERELRNAETPEETAELERQQAKEEDEDLGN